MIKEKSCGAVVFKDGKVLLIKHNAGHYAFPKGHMENGETEAETALREIKEETGLSVNIDTDFKTVVTYSPYKDCIKDVVYFVATNPSGDIKPQLEEVSSVKFVNLDEAESIITYQNDKDVFRKAKDYYFKTV